MSAASCKFDWKTDRCSCGGSGGRTESIGHHLHRERTYTSGDKIWFEICGKDVPATRKLDVDLIYHNRTVWHGGVGIPMHIDDYPACPDCGGEIVWAEAGRVPGSRKCDACGSTFVDTAYGHAAEVPA